MCQILQIQPCHQVFCVALFLGKICQYLGLVERNQTVYFCLYILNLLLGLIAAILDMLVNSLEYCGHPPQTMQDVIVCATLKSFDRRAQILQKVLLILNTGRQVVMVLLPQEPVYQS